MVTPKLTGIVLFGKDLLATKEFYENLLQKDFTKERHGSGPEHYSMELDNLLMEIYPDDFLYGVEKSSTYQSQMHFEVDHLDAVVMRVGKRYLFSRPERKSIGYRAIMRDPDNRLVYLLEKNQDHKKSK